MHSLLLIISISGNRDFQNYYVKDMHFFELVFDWYAL